MREFTTAVVEEGLEVDEEDVTTFKHDGREVTFYRPGTGQEALMLSMSQRDMEAKDAASFINLFFSLMDSDTYKYFEKRLMDRNDPFDLDSEGGIFDLFIGLSEEWSGRPTKEPSDYQPPQQATGKKSTASTRAKASTSSSSRSRASSR